MNNQLQKEQIIAQSIDCKLMDILNMSKIISEYTIYTLLQEKWNEYSKDIICDDELIIEKILKNDEGFLSIIFIKLEIEYINTKKEYNNQIKEYMNQEIITLKSKKKEIEELEDQLSSCKYKLKNVLFLNYLADKCLSKVDFKYFNASLMYSITFEDFDTLNEDLLHKEQDGFCHNDKEKFDVAWKSARYIYIARKCLITILNATEEYGYNVGVDLQDLKYIFEKYNTSLNKETWNRIWKRAFKYDLSMYD